MIREATWGYSLLDLVYFTVVLVYCVDTSSRFPCYFVFSEFSRTATLCSILYLFNLCK